MVIDRRKISENKINTALKAIEMYKLLDPPKKFKEGVYIPKEFFFRKISKLIPNTSVIYTGVRSEFFKKHGLTSYKYMNESDNDYHIFVNNKNKELEDIRGIPGDFLRFGYMDHSGAIGYGAKDSINGEESFGGCRIDDPGKKVIICKSNQLEAVMDDTLDDLIYKLAPNILVVGQGNGFKVNDLAKKLVYEKGKKSVITANKIIKMYF